MSCMCAYHVQIRAVALLNIRSTLLFLVLVLVLQMLGFDRHALMEGASTCRGGGGGGEGILLV